MDDEYVKYLNKILDTLENVRTEIYVITNKGTGLQYVGRARTHKKNHMRYRPYGTTKRWDTHKSMALNMKGHVRCLNNAIRKHGIEDFDIEMIERCEISVEKERERYWMRKLSTFHPNGYNIQGSDEPLYTDDIEHVESTYSNPTWRTDKKSDDTKAKIGEGIRNFLASQERREERMKQTQIQHLKTKLERFKDVVIDPHEDLVKYVRPVYSKDGSFSYYRFDYKDKSTTFYTKHETEEQLYTRVLSFLENLRQNQTQGSS